MHFDPNDGNDAKLLVLLTDIAADRQRSGQYARQHLRWFSDTSAWRRGQVMALKRELWRYKTKNFILFRLIKTELNCGEYDIDCLIAAIALYRADGIPADIAAKAVPTPKPVHFKRNELRHKIRLHLGDIADMRAKGYSWPRIAAALKRSWRKTFGGYEVDPTYLRRVVQSLTAAAEN